MLPTPSLGLKTALPPRRPRAPRKLNFLSCTSCRSASAKCKPGSRPWPAEKCQRCAEKNLKCSERLRKQPKSYQFAPNRLVASRAPVLDPSTKIEAEIKSHESGLNARPNDVSDIEQPNNVQTSAVCRLAVIDEAATRETDVLVLDDVFSLLGMAMEEFQVLCKELLNSVGGAYDTMKLKRYCEREKMCWETYSQVRKDISEAMDDFPRPVIESLVSRCDVWTDPLSLDIFDIDVEEKEHHGVGCIHEHMVRLDTECRFDLVPSPQSVSHFIRCRREFLTRCVTISSKFKFKLPNTRSILRSQLFIPNKLLRIPAIFEEVCKDGRRDCLGRSSWCMSHDAGVRTPWSELDVGDVDVIGRSAWNLAHVRHDAVLLAQLADKHPPPWRILGSSSYVNRLFHAAASKGHTAIFRSLQLAFPDEFRARMGSMKDERGFNCLHVAARKGHTSTVEYLCQNLPAQFVNRRKCARGRTALHIAAMGGHVDVMSCLIRASEKDCISDARDLDHRSAFWWAAWAGSVEGLKLLDTRWKRLSPRRIDERDVYGDTPFAISIINGNFEAARYILSLNTSSKVRVNINRDNTHSQTPLDRATTGRDTRGCFNKELEAFMSFLRMHGALTYDEMQEQEIWSNRGYEEDPESESDQEEDQEEQVREDELIDVYVEGETLMDVKSDFDSYFAQNAFDSPFNFTGLVLGDGSDDFQS